MRLVIDARMLHFGGIGTYLRNMIKCLKTDFNITILSTEQYEDLSLIKMQSGIYSVREQWELFRKVPSCDIFWSPHYNVPLLTVKAGRRVVTLHDVFHLANRHKLSFAQRMYAEYVIRRAVLLSDLTITVSEFSRNEIIKHTGLDKKIAVVHNGLDHDLFRPESPKEAVKSTDFFPYLLFVGNVKPHKNLKTALLAFRKIRDKYPELHFLIAGQKDNLITADHDVMDMARSDKRIHFKGIIEGEELADLYRRALLFVFPSVYESFGLPLIEAQACGCPVLMADTASPPEVCADSALCCAPFNVSEMAQKIVEILESQQLRQDLINRGYCNAGRFSWEKAAEQTRRELQQLF